MKTIKESIIQYCFNKAIMPKFILESPEWQRALEQLLTVIQQWARDNKKLAEKLLLPVEKNKKKYGSRIVVDLGSPQKEACIDCEPEPIIRIKKVAKKTSLKKVFKEMNNAK